MTAESSFRAGFVGIMMLTAAAIAASAGSAAAAATPIKHCQTISVAGFYKVANNLTYAGISECLRITASNVVINFNNFNLTGPGAATGIRIIGNNVLIEANDTVISNFVIGIEDDGNSAVVEKLRRELE